MTDDTAPARTDAASRGEAAATAARAGGRRAMADFRTHLRVETKRDKNDLVTATDRAAQRAVVDALQSTHPGEPVVAEEDDGAVGTGRDGATDGPANDREPASLPEDGPVWVVDPIDGTANYVRGLRCWTTSVAAVVDGRAVGAATVLPALGDAYTGGPDGSRANGEPAAVSDRDDPETFAVAVLGWGPSRDRADYAALGRTVIERFGDLRRLGSMQAALAFVACGGLDAAITTDRPQPWDAVAGAHLVEGAGGVVTDDRGEPWRHDSRRLVASNGRAHEAVLAAARDGTA